MTTQIPHFIDGKRTCPVLGLKTSAVRGDWPAVRFPSMKCGICVVMGFPWIAFVREYLHILVNVRVAGK